VERHVVNSVKTMGSLKCSSEEEQQREEGRERGRKSKRAMFMVTKANVTITVSDTAII